MSAQLTKRSLLRTLRTTFACIAWAAILGAVGWWAPRWFLLVLVLVMFVNVFGLILLSQRAASDHNTRSHAGENPWR